MKSNFKFFKGYIGTIDLMDGQTYATASIFNPNTYWTSEEIEREHAARMERARYFENPTYGTQMEMIRQDRLFGQMRNHGRISHEQYMMNRDMLIEQERIRRERMVEHSRQTDEQIRLFQATTTITVNPTLWTRVKMFGAAVKLILIESWRADPFGVIFVTLLMCLITFIGIMKLFGA
jgi:hypothetical protein